MRGAIANYPLGGKLFILLGLYLLGESLFSYLALYLTSFIIPDGNIQTLVFDIDSYTSADQFTIAQVQSLKLFQLLSSVGRFIITPLIFLYLQNKSVVFSTGLDKKINFRNIVLIIAVILSSTAIISFMQEWNASLHLPNTFAEMEQMMKNLEEQAQLQTDAFLGTTTIGGLLINIFIIGIVAAVGEELLFRGILQRIIYDHTGKLHLAVWTSAFVFSFIHLQFFGFFPRLLLGAVMGYVYGWSGSLRAPIFAHFINNTGAVITYYLINTNVLSEKFEEPSGWLQALITLPLFIIFILLYYRSTGYGKRLDNSVHYQRTTESMDNENSSGK
ncbi:MAG: CPBP family intramembrane metalloprotease [Bacteroidetes bacterium]|nr:CPBP family intramembrane metalloprotease [Bacteroidota bacterium]MBK8683226.1 CPBP family intramembrane metalloprotease [Bacteroidota bacterium]MBP8754162.1 CPBP family intramembrane metalloprotease [Chitinophagales bacterium]MBP9189586.1 CPBP family intramembrane metalloprotease [Chitinophagales bacterium]MBP9549031.1 CPBP family intramembrane metalloprotease [Chitinophagales bacterium]